jgi:enoyl-CoA hydratase/carnithine racemase
VKHLAIERSSEGVVTCTLSNPPTHTLTATGVLELAQMMDELEADPSVRVLVLTGGGEGVFIAHYEVGELADSAEQQLASPVEPAAESPASSQSEPELHPYHQLILRLERADFITVAALNGSAAGGGCELTLGCDFRLMADGAFLYGLPETLVGIIPGAGGTQRLARLLGTARALDLILHGQLLTPPQALELGLVHRLYPVESFRRDVSEFARDLAGRAPIALAAAKRAIRQGAEQPLEAGLSIEQDCFNRTMRSKDAAGAMRALLNGESWQWKGE